MISLIFKYVAPRSSLTRSTPSYLASVTHPNGHHTCYQNQIILARQLVEYGVDVNAVVMPNGTTPLHRACDSTGVIYLEFIEFLLQSGANPNAVDHSGRTPLVWTIYTAPGAAKVLIEWPATDINIVCPSGFSMLAFNVRVAIECFSGMTDNPSPESPRRAVEDQFLLQQWLEVEEMLVEKGGQ